MAKANTNERVPGYRWTDPNWNIPAYCVSCNCYHHYPYYCPNQLTTTTTTNAATIQEEPEMTDDKKTIDTLDAMRVARDSAVRLAQMKNDEASLLELEAVRLRGEADMVLREVNEQRKVKDAK